MLLLRDGMDCLVSGVDQSCQFHLLFIHPEFQSLFRLPQEWCLGNICPLDK